MAQDKVYTIRESTLKALGDGVRSLTKTDELYSPAEMAEALSSLNVGLGFELVASTTEPPDNGVNTLWVNTSVVIPQWEITPVEPNTADLPVGYVWIQNSTSSTAAFNALSENELTVYPVRCVQWDGTYWIPRAAYVRQNGVLTQFYEAIPPIGTSLNDCTWEDIRKISEYGLAKEYFSVGDRKAVAIKGTIQGYVPLAVDGTYYATILGIDHNVAREGKGIHFIIGASALSGGKQITFGPVTLYAQYTSEGKWSSGQVRSKWCAGFLTMLPRELQNVIRACTKYTDNSGNYQNVENSGITATTDKIWVPAKYEITGSTSGFGNPYEANYQEQYEYYKVGNSKIRYRHDSTNTAYYWVLRTKSTNASNLLTVMTTSGGVSNFSGYTASGFAPCFVI